ncbi:zinc dependent phospholipase C [Natranaerovirga pectinivora]|uniref:Zinc dependent phospholipase C n=1 Tax=Natranaerovirga pectinivora TaxID=682400 RepID=A0A4R3MNN3_9FIRM|nr:zinc dependent phospholipase C family protein [Natranaerovirga pectinivora]TCT14990.1 zinc dependent phospholipase C [Natranaerovirga pectinivora]
MIIKTHMLIGKNAYQNIQEEYNIQLNKKYFMYGNIKPDITYTLSNKSHRLQDSLDFVLKEIDKLIMNDEKNIETFSMNLGVINHFLSDFFCAPHYYKGSYFKNIVKHLRYEFKLNEKFKEMTKKNELSIKALDITGNLYPNIVTTIHSLETEYQKASVNIENDIKFAITLCTQINRQILNQIIIKNQKVAA